MAETATDNLRAAREAIEEAEEIKSRLREVLTTRDAAVARLHHVDGMSPPEIARRTGMSTSNVRLAIRLQGPAPR